MPNAKRHGERNGAPTKATKPKRRARKRKIPYFGRTKSIEEIAREQGKELRPLTKEDLARMRKLGKGLFRSHKEFDEFLAGIYERRRQGC